MNKKSLLAAVVAATAFTAAAEAPLWMRDVAISPDGSTVAFTYKGDIFTVPAKGGRAAQITSNDAYDSSPVWRPDGKQIVFRSNREGSDDIYIVDAKGGRPRRLTTHSGHERPLAFIDNGTLLFQANIQPSRKAIQGPFQAQAYTIAVDSVSPRPVQYMSVTVQAACFTRDVSMLYKDRK